MALPEVGKIICTDSSKENLKLANNYFQRGGLDSKVEFQQGDALELIQEIEGQFDIVLNDVEKERYPKALEIIAPRIRKGGFLITDNMFWHDRVVDPYPDKATRGVLAYTQNVYSSNKLWITVVPLRDGVGISLKL